MMSTDKEAAHRALVEQMERRFQEDPDQERRIRRLMEDVLGIAADLDLASVLQRIVDAAARAVGVRYCALGVLDENGEFSDLITTGAGPDVYRAVGYLPTGRGILGRVLHEDAPIRLTDIAAEPDAVGFPPGHPDMRTLLAGPIRIHDTVYGNLYLSERYDGEPFSSGDQALAAALANVAGGAIENARHHVRLEQAAQEMQRRLLPELPDIGSLKVEARYSPAHNTPRVGGDWYQAVELPDGTWCIVVGDVMGHDTGSALTMHQMTSMLYVLALDPPHSPARIVEGLDQALHRTGSETMATLVVATLQPAPGGSWRLSWTNAGHPPPLLLTPDGDAVYLDPETVHGIMIGVDHTQPQTEHVQVLRPGSTLLLYTDGLIEAHDRTLTEALDDLARRASALAGGPLDVLCDELGVPPTADRYRDDIALLALHVP
ncbi:hypothetical protein QR77_00690 [Streptomyces sp. 150FB]|nr:hypothetical protein QR77_00690 [Streptomyces sp. 150FB]